MKRDSRSKLSASLLVLVLALSALVFLPLSNTGQTPSGKNIYVPVVSGGLPVSGSGTFVNLTEVHTGVVTQAQFQADKSSYAVLNAQSGLYRVDVTSPGFYSVLGVMLPRYEAFTTFTATPIELQPFGDKQFTWNVTLKSASNNLPISGAKVGFYNVSQRQFVASGTTNSFGVVVLSMIRTTQVGDFDLVAIARGFETKVIPVKVTADNVTTVLMASSLVVSAFVTDFNGPAPNVVAYLINTDTSVVWTKRVMRTTGSFFAFDAYPGTFTLVIDATGDLADVETVTVTSSPVSLSRTLPNQTQRVEHVNMTFGANFNSFGLDVSTTWSYDDAYPGLMFNDMGSLRAQVDLNSNIPGEEGNGVLSPAEVADFISKVQGFGTQYVTSSSLMVVNDTVFTSAAVTTDFVLGLLDGSVINTAGVDYGYKCAYTSHTPISVDLSDYAVNLSARLNTPSVDYNYSIPLVTNYELIQNLTPPSIHVKVMGYLNVTVDANQQGTGTALVVLKVQISKRPVAGGAVSPSATASVVKNDTGVVLRYIVRNNTDVTFTANSSSDPNGDNPLTFIWNFDDSTPIVTTMNRFVVHKFTPPFALKHVNLTVQDVAGLKGYTLVNITSDSLDPVPVIGVNKLVVGNTIKVNQSQLVIFNATNCYDNAAIAGDNPDRLGVIDFVQFFFGDQNLTGRISWTNPNKNASHSYERADDYVVTLNVTDVVGHFKNTTLNVHVNDTTAPTVAFTVRNQTYGDNVVENLTMHFDANTTRDNVLKNNYTLLNYSWGFGDGTWQNATGIFNVTHKYTRVGQVIVTLRVTDSSNNTGVLTRVLSIASGPRPNVVIENLFFSPQTAAPFAEGNLTQGKTGTILVNLTNKGNAVATNVIVSFYLVPSDGSTPQKIGESGSLINTTTGLAVTTIEPGGKVQVRFAYDPPSRGTFTIKVNVTSTDQLVINTRTNNALHVGESPLTRALLYIGVIVVIVGVPLLLYFRSRWSKREKKGPRRERKEKEPEEEEKT